MSIFVETKYIYDMRKKILAILAIISFVLLIIEIAKSINVLTAVR